MSARSLRWDLTECRRILAQKGLSGAEKYLNSLSIKRRQAEYHAANMQQKWDSLWSPPRRLITHLEIGKALEEAHFEFESGIYALRSSLDILAQFLNEVFQFGMKENQVSFCGFLQHRNFKTLPPKIVQLIKGLEQSKEYKYINSYCNTVKHRNAILPHYHLEFHEGSIDQGFLASAFQHRNKNYPPQYFEILHDAYALFQKAIIEVGDATNNFLKTLPNASR